MVIRQTKFEKHPCANCGQDLTPKTRIPTKSPMFIDGYLPYCRDCLNDTVFNYAKLNPERENGSWEKMNEICRWADMAFIPADWTKLWTTNPEKAAGLYLDMFMQREYADIDWARMEKKWQEAVANNKEEEIHPAFDVEKGRYLEKVWGSAYGELEYLKLEDIYQGLKDSYNFSDVTTEDQARKIAKLSVEIDRAIENGSDVSKLATAYQNFCKSAGFSAENASDPNTIESVAELMLVLEKTGWEKKFHTNEKNDIVDTTILDIQAWTRRLYEQEATIPDQVEQTLDTKARIEEAERRVQNQNIENWNDNISDINAIDFDEEDDEEQEEFILDIEKE